ncbi:N-acetylneuraminate synthase family protein [Agrilactobacillus fermenti]|uniref:N-acetylneuraminate synthase family protein n=1 Tax=Agrilactobacillus fermenti TaxID=2586909 RepID=UPI001E349B57|nr:N-acetylneuraminate synthase family protein [Agrilactobacillus fermenti]MCD2255824.1 N-acetylneuraminate synthase family protein [Agrilactobacillus fermenti]
MIIHFKQPLQTNIVQILTKKFASMGKHGFLIDNHLTVLGIEHYDFNQDELNAIDVVIPEQPSFVLASRDFKPDDTLIKLPNGTLGGNNFTLVAGPDAVESEEMIHTLARVAKQGGARILSASNFVNIDAPYDFAGLGEAGLKYLRAAADEMNMDVMSQVTNSSQISTVGQYADILEVGPENMRNSELLQALGKQKKPVALHQSNDATIEDWLNATEFIASEGNQQIILMASGTVSFDHDFSQSDLDIATIPIIHNLSHYPLLVDPGKISASSELVRPIARAAIAAGAQGVKLSIHEDPTQAQSKAGYAITPNEYMEVTRQLLKLAQVVTPWETENNTMHTKQQS